MYIEVCVCVCVCVCVRVCVCVCVLFKRSEFRDSILDVEQFLSVYINVTHQTGNSYIYKSCGHGNVAPKAIEN